MDYTSERLLEISEKVSNQPDLILREMVQAMEKLQHYYKNDDAINFKSCPLCEISNDCIDMVEVDKPTNSSCNICPWIMFTDMDCDTFVYIHREHFVEHQSDYGVYPERLRRIKERVWCEARLDHLNEWIAIYKTILKDREDEKTK